jgi:hypothetical protein
MNMNITKRVGAVALISAVAATGGVAAAASATADTCNDVAGTSVLSYQRPVHRVVDGLHMGSYGSVNRGSGSVFLHTDISNTYWFVGYKTGTTVVLKNRCGQAFHATDVQHGWVDSKAFGKSVTAFNSWYSVPPELASRTASVEVVHAHTPQGIVGYIRTNRPAMCSVYGIIRTFVPSLPSECLVPTF